MLKTIVSHKTGENTDNGQKRVGREREGKKKQKLECDALESFKNKKSQNNKTKTRNYDLMYHPTSIDR